MVLELTRTTTREVHPAMQNINVIKNYIHSILFNKKNDELIWEEKLLISSHFKIGFLWYHGMPAGIFIISENLPNTNK